MKFRTEYTARPSESLLDPEKPVVLIGSCFTDNIGERMRFCRWSAYPNITGTLFNPSSIANILRIACKEGGASDMVEDSMAECGRLWATWLADSRFTTCSRSETRSLMLDRLIALRQKLAAAQALIVTFGTAWIYELAERPGYVVSNCHKFPPGTFVRRRLSVAEIAEEWRGLVELLGATCPKLRIIFTVSPVRHLKDGFEEGSLSKATLRLACDEICRASNRAEYFPAFEIVNDDLRDYRFYASDLVHPSPEAVDYIWQKFQERYLSAESQRLLAEGEKVTKRLNHRPHVYGGSEFADCQASLERHEASQYYNAFMAAHPGMLHMDE